MIRASSSFALLVAVAAGCPSSPAEDGGEASETEGPSSSTEPTGADGTTIGDGTTTADATDDTGPSGPCVLEGMFEACTEGGTEGVAYCDEIDGELQWGPCLDDVACELGESLQGCQRCTLVEGVPTVEGSPTCECEGPVDAPPCEQTECFQRWDWSCDACESFTAGDCFSYDQGCTNPWLGCLVDARFPCSRVWAQGGAEFDVLSALEDETAAVCVLTSLRDGVPGTFEILLSITPVDGIPIASADAHHVHAYGPRASASTRWPSPRRASAVRTLPSVMAIAVMLDSEGQVVTRRESGTVAAREPCERTEQREQVAQELGVAVGHVGVLVLEREAAQAQEVLERSEDLGRAHGAPRGFWSASSTCSSSSRSTVWSLRRAHSRSALVAMRSMSRS